MVCVAWSHPQGRWDVRTPDETLMRQALALRHSHDSVDTRSNHAAAVWPLIFGLQRLGRSPPRSRWRSFRRPGREKTRRRISLQLKEREALVTFCAPMVCQRPARESRCVPTVAVAESSLGDCVATSDCRLCQFITLIDFSRVTAGIADVLAV